MDHDNEEGDFVDNEFGIENRGMELFDDHPCADKSFHDENVAAANRHSLLDLLRENSSRLQIDDRSPPILAADNAISFSIFGVTNKETAKSWRHEFEAVTGDQYNVRRGASYTLSKTFQFICKNSDHGKDRNGPRNNPIRSKKRGCEATLSIRVQHTAEPTTPAVVTLKGSHTSHNTFHDLSLRSVSDQVKGRCFSLFAQGFDVPSVRKMLESEASPDSAENCMDTSQVPSSAQLYYLFNIYRRTSFGGRTYEEVYSKINERKSEYEEMGIKVLLSEAPFAVTFLTPMMQRVHELPESAQMLFLDSTSCCDSMGVTVTPYIVQTAVGSLPCGVSLTASESEASYATALSQLASVRGSFCGAGAPQSVMRDDSGAERNAIASVFPGAKQYVCSFHVLNAHWRWLHRNTSDKDRQYLYSLIKQLVTASSETAAESLFKGALEDAVVKKHKKQLADRLHNLWDGRQHYLQAFRSHDIRGSNTNNLSEITMRIIKDVVLHRSKAYNAVSLLNYLSSEFDHYFRMKVLKFASGTDQRAFKRIDQLVTAAKQSYANHSFYIKSDGSVEVASSSTDGLIHEVSTTTGHCSCYIGRVGRLCKHVAAVSVVGGINIPHWRDERFSVDKRCRALYFYIATGEVRDHSKFTLHGLAHTAAAEFVCADSGVPLDSQPSTSTSFSAPEVQPAETSTATAATRAAIVQRVSHLVDSLDPASCTKLNSKLSKMSPHEFFGRNVSYSKGHYAGATIRVQPTAVNRRSHGLSKASTRIGQGRPAKVVKQMTKQARTHALSQNVANNSLNSYRH